MEIDIRLTTEEEKNDPTIPAFDYTKLTALNTCPRWGLIRYDQHKAMPSNSRSMALEMGSAAHQVFSAIRFFELMEEMEKRGGESSSFIPQIANWGIKQFGEERFIRIVEIGKSNEDVRQRVTAIALYTANSSGYYDNPDDRRRTLSNLESSLIAYIDRLELGNSIPVFKDGLIGIELPFDILLTFTRQSWNKEAELESTKIRYIGKIDGLVKTKYGYGVEENKTASRLDRAWQDSFLISHQVTGYCVAASTILGEPVRECMVRGMMVPLPKNYDLGGIVNLPVSRDHNRIREWYNWVWHTVSHLYYPYHLDPLNAPEFSHSCNRYFQPCSFIPLCAMADPEERKLTFSQMIIDEWNPLHEQT